jgi:hypothetical protein
MPQAVIRIGGNFAGASTRRRIGDSPTMKIMIIKKAVQNAKPQGLCPIYVDDFPVNQK